VWTTDKVADRGWCHAASSTLLAHLRYCRNNISADVCNRAKEDHIARGGTATPSKPRGSRPLPINTSLPPQPLFSLHPSSSTCPSSFPASHNFFESMDTEPTSLSMSLNSPDSAGSSPHGFMATFTGTPSSSPCPSPLTDIHRIQLPSASLGPSPFLVQTPYSSRPSSPTGLGINLGSRNSHSHYSALHRGTVSQQASLLDWSLSKQSSFERRIARLTASAGLPFTWVDNPEWLAFLAEFVPAAKSPSQKTLAHRLIPKAVEELRADVKAVSCGHEAIVLNLRL
jgi:hypothetical protein